MWELYIPIVGSQFGAQALNVWGLGPMSPIQWICREWVQDRILGFGLLAFGFIRGYKWVRGEVNNY